MSFAHTVPTLAPLLTPCVMQSASEQVPQSYFQYKSVSEVHNMSCMPARSRRPCPMPLFLVQHACTPDLHPPRAAGGYRKFREYGYDSQWLPTWLRPLGYRTYFTGKFVNLWDVVGAQLTTRSPRGTGHTTWVVTQIAKRMARVCTLGAREANWAPGG